MHVGGNGTSIVVAWVSVRARGCTEGTWGPSFADMLDHDACASSSYSKRRGWGIVTRTFEQGKVTWDLCRRPGQC